MNNRVPSERGEFMRPPLRKALKTKTNNPKSITRTQTGGQIIKNKNMSTTPKISQKIATLLVCTIFLFSCLKEDMSNCPEQIRVYFTFTNKHTLVGEGYPIDPDDINQKRLYVFSHTGYYLGEYHDAHIANFNEEYYIDCSDLLPGKYRFVAWGGQDESCYSTALGHSENPAPFIKSTTGFDEALLMLKHSGNDVTTPVHQLFHSSLPVTVTNTKIQRFDMPVMQITNTVNIRTAGLPAGPDAYRFQIIDNNDAYTFDGLFATGVSDPTFSYTTPCTKDGTGQLSATLNVMRLAANRHKPQLQIYNETAGKPLYHTEDLIGLIQKADPNNDFDTTHIYNIDIIFDEGNDTNFTFTILINGWAVREQGGDLTE